MSTKLSSRILTSRSSASVEVADDDVVVALMVEDVTDEQVAEAVIDDDNYEAEKVVVAKAVKAKPLVSKAKKTQPEAAEVQEACEPSTATDVENPVLVDEQSTSQNAPTQNEDKDPINVALAESDSNVSKDSDNCEPTETPYSIEQSVGLAPLSEEAELPLGPSRPAAKPQVKQPQPETIVAKPPTISASVNSSLDLRADSTPDICSIEDKVSVPFIKKTRPKAPSVPRKKIKTPERTGPKIVDPDLSVAAVELSDPEPPPVLTYGEWFRERISESKLMTSFFAFYAHWLLLIVLALLVVHGPNTRGDFTITASNVVPIEYEPVDVIDTRIVEPEPEITEINSRTSPTLPIDMSVSSPALPDAFLAEEAAPGAVDEPNKKDVVASQIASLSPGSEMKRGSFSVWTVPEFPEPGESYKVVIRAKVPEGIKRFPVNDLQGVVIGSDGYRKLIPGSLQGFLPIQGGYVQFEVPIVAANQEIKDTVWIQSKMLKEQQKLLIEF